MKMKAKLAILLILLLLLPIYAGNQVKIKLADKVKLTLAGGGDLVVNGDFSIDNDPPLNWNSANSALLTTEGAGKSGNCLMITENGGNYPKADSDSIAVTVGERYYFIGYVKAGTEATYRFKIFDIDNGTHIENMSETEETVGDWSTFVTYTFEIPAGCTQIKIELQHRATSGAGTTCYFDSISLKEIPTKVTLH